MSLFPVRGYYKSYYVMEPFDLISKEWTSNIRQKNTELNFTVVKDEEQKLFGKGALLVSYKVLGEAADFGWVLKERAHNCYGATHVSFWYNIIEKQSPVESAKMKLVFYDDSHCEENCDDPMGSGVEIYYSLHNVLDNDTGQWNELIIDLNNMSDHDSLFQRSKNLGIAGNEILDLDRIRGWRIEIEPVNKEENHSISGKFIIDQISCKGNEKILSENVFPKKRKTLNEFSFEAKHLENHNKQNESLANSIRLDGELSLNYTLRNTENFQAYEYMAPGFAYFNLSLAIKLKYEVLSSAYPTGMAYMRFTVFYECGDKVNKEDAKTNYCNFLDDINILDNQGISDITLFSKHRTTNSSFLTSHPLSKESTNDSNLDLSYVKGFRFEFRVHAGAPKGSTVKGRIKLFHLDPSIPRNVRISERNLNNELGCMHQTDIQIKFNDVYTRFHKVTSVGGSCCEGCKVDPFCNYLLEIDGECLATNYFHERSVALSKNLNMRVYWMDDTSKRGNFCQKCLCEPTKRTINCYGRHLSLPPNDFTESWEPEILDLRKNYHLVILGEGAFDSIKSSLKELKLPNSLRYLSESLLQNLPQLQILSFEDDNNQIVNVVGSTLYDNFGDVCCELGTQIPMEVPATGITFCEIQDAEPGIDSVMLPFVQHVDAEQVAGVQPSSTFMFDAADSPGKCAEFCTLTDHCAYFSFDERISQPDHRCYLQVDNGTRQEVICCHADDFADEAKTIPGWTSGRPPQTRRVVDNARVSVSTNHVYLDTETDFYGTYEVSLGSVPLRGAVWVTPTLLTNPNFGIQLNPTHMVLYDNTTKVTVKLKISNPDLVLQTDTIIIHNNVESCDAAFSMGDSSLMVSNTTVFLYVAPYSSTSFPLTITVVPILISSLFVLAYLYTARQRRLADKIWEIQLKDIVFSDPPEVIGRGTFGLVLLAEYRGTLVAVKRVIPPKLSRKSSFERLSLLFGKGATDSNPHLSKITSLSNQRRSSTLQSSEVFDDAASAQNNEPIDNTKNLGKKGTKVAWVNISKDIDQVDLSNHFMPESVFAEEGMTDKLDSSHISLKLDHSTMKNFTRRDSLSISDNSSPNRERNRIYHFFSIFHKNEYATLKLDFIREMRYLSKLRHPCITTVMGAVIDHREEPMLVMEYMDHGSLYDLLHNQTYTIGGEHILPILRDISHGMRFLHCATPQIIHGDLKAANILIDSKFRAKVSDFGLSQKKHVGASGTIFWMAPELLRGTSLNTAASDVYSFGIILFEVYSRQEPFDGEDFTTVVRGIIHGMKRPPIPSSCPKEISDLMSTCLSVDPEKRNSFEEIDKKLQKLEIESIEPRDLNLSLQEKKEKEMTDSLLNDVFPKHIAEALRAGRKIEPESRDMVTIFFSDIVGFTKISSSLPAIKVSHMLDRLYADFDALSRYYDIFKVETIGDAYMAVTNLVKDQPDHTKRIAEFSIAVIKAAGSTIIDEDNPDLGYVNIRVGFHSGPVVANVIGSRNPRYCLFGDTVNTASRMESNSKKNRILCSERAAKLLMTQSPDISLCARGKIQVKGKGEMSTYWVNEYPQPSHKTRRKSLSAIDRSSVESKVQFEDIPKTALRRRSLQSVPIPTLRQ